jgi:protein-disulfide isomerase
VALVEFSDYQCPFCARNFKQTIPQVMSEYVETGKVKYIFRDYPLIQIHPHAFKAAEAAHCGGDQGKYWEMHDKLFTNQTSLSPENLATYAKDIGLDVAQYEQCMDSSKHGEKIRNDMAEAQKAGVSGTPGFLFGLTEPDGKTVKVTKLISGAQPYANFKAAIDSLLTEAGE